MQLAKSGSKPQGLRKEKASEERWSWLMIALPVIGFFVLTVYPILWTFRWSFYSYNGVASQTAFIGLRNFTSLFTTDLTYWKTWINTIQFAILKVPIELTLAMVIALMLTGGKRKGSNFFRTMYYIPNIVSIAIIGVVFSNMFQYFGVINVFLEKIGVIANQTEYIDWMSSKWTAMAVVVIGSIWNTFGTNVMYFMAALANVPEELYECAALDGATGLTRFFKITLPLILPVGQIVLLLSIVGTLGTNEYILVLTGGAPAGGTNTVMSYMTSQFVPGFATSAAPALGYGCAMALITSILFCIIAIAYNKINAKLSNLY